MSLFGFRPHFSQTLDLEPEAAQAKILRELKQSGARCEVRSFPGFVCLRIPEKDRHFFSPRLNLSLDPAADGTTRIEGLYGPNANAWALFLFGYLITGSLALFSGTLGFVQWSLASPPWGLWIFGAMLAAMIALYLVARFGQNLGAPQTSQLHQIFEAALGDTVQLD